MKNLKFLLIAIILFFSFRVFAAVNVTNIEMDTTSVVNTEDPYGWWVYFGASPGQVDVKSSSSLEPNRDGHNMNFKLLGSYYSEDRNWVFDGGLGYQGVEVSSAGSDRDANAVFVDLGARHRLQINRRVQVGAVANLLLTGDSNYNGGEENLATFVGAAADYEFPLYDMWTARVGGRLLTDVNISGRRVNQYLLNLQIGLPYSYKPAPVAVIEEVTPEPMPVVQVKLDEIKYSQTKVIPSQQDQAFLENLGARLYENKDLFSEIRIKAHSGSEGKKKNTDKIVSHSRARHVLKWLAQGGYPIERLTAQSAVAPRAKDKTAQAKARFVELEFTGVKDEAKLQEIIQEIR